MFGRGVAQELTHRPPDSLVSSELVELVQTADHFILNLECCISERGTPAAKPATFRAPPTVVETLSLLGVTCVTLANNHVLDYGTEALVDTLNHLRDAGIRSVGAGEDIHQAREPVVLDDLTIVALCDHEPDFAAGLDRPGIAYVDLQRALPRWLRESASGAVVCPHWGPNLVSEPRRYIRDAAMKLRESGAVLVAGTSAHVFHGVDGNILYDMGNFLDDYRSHPRLRNDLSLLFLVDIEDNVVRRIELVPLKLEFAHTRLARGEETDWIRRRFRQACDSVRGG